MIAVKRNSLLPLLLSWLLIGDARGGSPLVQNVKTDHSAVGDAKKIESVATTIASGAIVTLIDTFVVGDVGKRIWCNSTGAGEVNPNIPWTTIASFTDARHVTTTLTSNGTTSSAVCVFGTQDDTTPFVNAYNAAIAPAGTSYPEGSPVIFKGSAGTVYAPGGGYIVSSRIYNKQDSGLAAAPSLIGDGMYKTVLFLRPDMTIPGDGTGVLIQATGTGATFGNFSVDGSHMNFPGWGATQDLIRFISLSNSTVEHISVRYAGQTASAEAALVAFHSCSELLVNGIYVKDGPSLSTMISCKYNATAAVVNTNIWCSNGSQSIVIIDNLQNWPLTKPLIFIGGSSDECGHATLGCLELRNAEATFIGSKHWGGNAIAPAITVDATSRLFLNNSSAGAFNSGSAAVGMRIAAGGIVTMAASTIYGNTAASKAVVNLGTLVDLGGNTYKNCTGATCTAKTAGQAVSGKPPVRR